MIQRKQTLFLIFVIALFVPLFFMDLAAYEYFGLPEVGDKIYTISTLSLYPLAILASLVVLLSGVTIFMYKKTSLQLRLSIINIVIIFGYIGIEAYSIYRFYNSPIAEGVTEGNFMVRAAAFFALPALVFAFLSFKGIAKDIFLLRSFNRMR